MPLLIVGAGGVALAPALGWVVGDGLAAPTTFVAHLP